MSAGAPDLPGLWILGAGGHGRVAADAARASGRFGRIGFFDDAIPVGNAVGAWPVLGAGQAFLEEAPPGVERFVAIGDNSRRDAMLMRILSLPTGLATIVHPHAWVSPDARLGPGTLVAAGAVVAIGAEVGPGGIVNHGASLDHDCRLGRAVHLSPGARLGGGVAVGDRSWIGIGAAVRQGVEVGRDAVVGAGAVVVARVADNTRVVGNPARPMATRRDA